MLGGEVRLRNVANLGNDGLEATAREDGADYRVRLNLADYRVRLNFLVGRGPQVVEFGGGSRVPLNWIPNRAELRC